MRVEAARETDQPPGLDQVATSAFRATAEADEIAQKIKDLLGAGAHYVPARLALARSLAIPEPPPKAEGEPGRQIKGDVLFGTGEDLATWVSLFVEYDRAALRDLADLQRRVRDHWVRGLKLLDELLEKANREASAFLRHLAETCLPRSSRSEEEGEDRPSPMPVARSIELALGPVGVDAETGEPIRWRPVAPGGSPHAAFMGGVGSGKTRNAVHMLKALREQVSVPLLAFDFKGDMTEAANALDRAFEATVLAPPHQPVPLDVLALPDRTPTTIALAAQRLRDTLSTLKGSGFGAVQKGLLATAAEQALRDRQPCRLSDVRDALDAAYAAQGRNPDGASATMDDLCRFALFEPELAPADFFARSWIVRLAQDLPELVRVAIVTLMTDGLDRWLNSLPDSPVDESGNRALRVVALIDEAHRILGARLPGLSGLVRLSRSKGGMVWLISQSPDDFEGEDDDFLAEMGLVMAFSTNARPGSTRRIFGGAARLAGLGPGEAWVKLRGEPARRARVWTH